ncbi:hypothetical protein GCM10009550_76410 [Actinocorallia libanotica]|uniref:Uncharacterized protein n=1 Tax=Actinocorallia libanotica TaxID=46162 RepID=A0ABP4CHH1_9ACTN
MTGFDFTSIFHHAAEQGRTSEAALTRWTQDPSGRERAALLAAMIDAQDALYSEAIAALERDDSQTAERLLRHCARMRIGDAGELLNELVARRHSPSLSARSPGTTAPNAVRTPPGVEKPSIREEFSAQLRRLYQECGVSSLSELSETCRCLPDRYPEFYPDRFDVPAYSKSTFSAILNGRRKCLPDPRFVTAFVLSCQSIAELNGLKVSENETLSEWHEKLRRYEDESYAVGQFVRRGYQPWPVERIWFRPASTPLPRSMATNPTPVALGARQKETITEYGAYGDTLLIRIDQGDPHALYQGSLLLMGQSGDDDSITRLLTVASTTNHTDALALLSTDPSWIDRSLANTQATFLADRANQTGYDDAAVAFNDCATHLDHLLHLWGNELRPAERI